jgi:hypothetical protein
VDIAKIDSDIIQRRDPLLALRLFELVITRLCQVYEKKLCFLLDEFDEAYQNLPREIFLQLRAVRDANKNRVSFALFLRNLPERLRTPKDNESFYELLSRNLIGIGPYDKDDALETIQQLEARKGHSLSSEQREKLFHASDGHPGLILALLSVLITRIVPKARCSGPAADLYPGSGCFRGMPQDLGGLIRGGASKTSCHPDWR